MQYAYYRIASKVMQLQPNKLFAYVISVLHNLMDPHWWGNETIEMHVCKLSVGLEKPNFYKIMSIIGSWLACICQVMDALRNFAKHSRS